MARMAGVKVSATLSPLQRFLILYAMLYAAFGVASPFLPAFLEQRGLFPEQIGLFFAAGTAIRLMSAPLAGRLADRWHARREILAVCAIAAGIAALLYLPVSGFAVVLLVGLLHALALAPVTPLSDALALLAAKHPRGAVNPGFEYGWVRGTGSAAFILGSIFVGWAISVAGLPIIIWLQAALLMAVPIAVRLVPEADPSARGELARPVITRQGVRELLRLVPFRLVVMVAALILGSHGMHDTFSMIRWTAAGITPQTASVLWSASVIAEVVVFLSIGPLLLRRLTPEGCIAIASIAGALRWLVAAMTTDIAALALIQPLHGITFALLHLACMQLLAEHVPPGLAATAQAVYGAVGIAVASALVTLASGWLYARMGGSAFAIMSIMCLAALPFAWKLYKLRRDREKHT
jgi:MFS transporter, PPP family, 3-phenylpropionic acid transporter